MARKKSKPKVDESQTPSEAEGEAAGQALEQLPPPQAPASVPAKASCLTFIVLLMTELTVIGLVLLSRRSMPFEWPWLVVVTLLVFIIPLVVYRAVALWMFDEISRYPDIAQAWYAGIRELSQHGMSLVSAPLFIIVGTGNDKLRRSFMNAAAGDFFLDGAPDVPAPIHWYANSDGIFLYLNDVSWMNAAITLYELHVETAKSGRQMPGEMPRGQAAERKIVRALGTLMPDVHSSPAKQPAASGGLPSDLPPTEGNSPTDAAPRPGSGSGEQARPRVAPAANRYLGTLTPDQVLAPAAVSSGSAPAASRASSGTGRHGANRLTSQQSGQQLQRLEHVCALLRKNRHPVCPANGILTLLPFDMLKAGDQDVAELERAVNADLATIYRELELRCPVTAVVVGMDQERGFRELIRRIGRQDVSKQRFGQRFDLRASATVDELRKFTSHVCGTFEDWVYTLFREEQALSHPGNTTLYALLCKVRRTLKTRLGDVLGRGFGYDRQSGNLPILFSGCYFAATGPKSDRQAFVSGLLSKLYDEQEDIEWTEGALREDRRRGWLTRIGWLLCGFVVLFIAGWYLLDKF